MGGEPVIVDCDPATGYALRDVDDGLALLYLLAFPLEFELLGVTTVYGNASLKRTSRKAREILRVAGREDLPVLSGASSPRLLGSPTPASDFLNECASRYPGELVVLAIAPLTNVATAGITDPDFYAKLRRLVVMGGALGQGFGIPLVPPFEFNFLRDRRAADLVLAAPCEKVLITAELCRTVVFTTRELDSLWATGSRVTTYLAYRIEPWLRLNRAAPFLPWKGGFVPWDLVAAVYLRRPDFFSHAESRGMKIRGGRPPAGVIVPDPSRDGFPCTLPQSVAPEAVLDEFLDAMAIHAKR